MDAYPIGHSFNRLTVLGEAEPYKGGRKTYLCICTCGETTRTSLVHLRRGEVQSCGCLSRERARENGKKTTVLMVGKRIGRLTVLKEAHRSKNGTLAWECLCDCGSTKVISGHLLRRGSSNSCGCLAIEELVRRNVSRKIQDPWKVEARVYESQNATTRGLAYELSVEAFKKIVTSDCHYCGRAGVNSSRRKELKKIPRNGIDRKDNSRGYDLENCVPCCGTCNKMKHTLGYIEFVEHIRRIYQQLASVA